MLDRVAQFLAHDLTRDQVHAVIRVGWRAGVIAFVAWACGAFGVLGLPGFARAADAATVKNTVTALGDKVEKWRAEDKLNRLEQDMGALDREIFSIEARLAELGRLGQVADALYTQRLSELKIQRSALRRQIARAEQDPALKAGGDEG